MTLALPLTTPGASGERITPAGRGRSWSSPSSSTRGAQLRAQLAAALAGDVIRLAGGQFNLSADVTIPAGVTLLGSGCKTTTIAGTARTINLSSDVTVRDLGFRGVRLDGTGVRDVRLTDVFIDGAGSAADHDGIQLLNDCRNVVIRGCRITGAARRGIYVLQSQSILIDGCFVEGAATDGIYTQRIGAVAGGVSTDDITGKGTPFKPLIMQGVTVQGAGRYGWFDRSSHDARATGCAFEDCAEAGAFIQTPIQVGLSNCMFERNSSSGTDEAELVIQMQPTAGEGSPDGDVQVTGCNFQSENLRCVLLDDQGAAPYHLSFVGNYFRLISTEANASVMRNNGGWHADTLLTIAANQFFARTQTSGQRAILLYDSTNANADGIRIHGNTFKGLTEGVEIQRLEDVLVESNSFLDCGTGVQLLANAQTSADVYRNRFRNVTTPASVANGATYTAVGNDGLADQ